MSKEDEQLSLFGSGDVVDVDHAKKFEVPKVCNEEVKDMAEDAGLGEDREEK